MPTNHLNETDQPENTEHLESSLSHPSPEELIKQLNEADAKLNEYRDMALRTQAELENYKRRVEKDIHNAHKYANERYIREFIDVFDNIDYSITAAHAENADLKSIQKGLELTAKILHNMQERLDLKLIDPLGAVFNPTLHEAMNIEETDAYPPNTVTRVLQRGYQLHDRVIRPARVTVAKEKSDAS